MKEIKSLIFKRFCRYNEDSGTILCENFENYASLEFSSFEKSIKNIILNPLKNQILDDNLQFGKLDVKSNYEVKLSRVVQIDILSNPFASINASINNLLLFSDSIFEIIYENNKIDSNMCSNLAQNEIFISLVETSSSLILDNTVFSAYPYCQYFFNQANLEYFKVMKMTKNQAENNFQNLYISATQMFHCIYNTDVQTN